MPAPDGVLQHAHLPAEHPGAEPPSQEGRRLLPRRRPVQADPVAPLYRQSHGGASGGGAEGGLDPLAAAAEAVVRRQVPVVLLPLVLLPLPFGRLAEHGPGRQPKHFPDHLFGLVEGGPLHPADVGQEILQHAQAAQPQVHGATGAAEEGDGLGEDVADGD